MWKPDKLRFGTAGIPHAARGSDTIGGIKKVRELGLDAFELEFVRSVNISKEKAPEVKKTAKEQDIALSCHGQYWVNLNAQEKIKLDKSKGMILTAAKRVWECGGWSVTWHMAFYMKQDPKKVYEIVKQNLKEILKKLKDDGVNIWIRPEVTGKISQWGDLNEVLRMSQELENVMPCIDYSHLHARSQGKYNSYEEFKQVLEQVEKYLGKEGLNNMHIQAQGVKYGPTGEREHMNFKDTNFKYREMVKSWKDFKIKGVVICESPNIEEDSLLLQRTSRQGLASTRKENRRTSLFS